MSSKNGHEFGFSRLLTLGLGAIGAAFLGIGLLDWFRHGGISDAVFGFVMGVLQLGMAAAYYTRPYIKITDEHLVVFPSPILRANTIPWSAVRRATQVHPGVWSSKRRRIFVMSLANGRPFQIDLGLMNKDDRDRFHHVLEARLGQIATAE